MKLSIISAVCFTIFFANPLHAQNALFYKTGVIEFEKTINMFAVIKRSITKDNEFLFQEAFDKYKQNNKQFKILKSTLVFSDGKTLFTPYEAAPESGYFSDLPMALQNNTVFTDFKSALQVSKKKVFNETYLLSDSTKKIRWKITDETKVIGGYNCRRANAIVNDSVYVVAFYSNEILVSGGPESFSGLPGMILQVTLPHENITWVAAKIQLMDVSGNTIQPPAGGKIVTRSQLRSNLEFASKNWGDKAGEAMKSFFL